MLAGSEVLDTFYREVVHHLTEWTPPAPRLAPSAEEEILEATPSERLTGDPPDAESSQSPGVI